MPGGRVAVLVVKKTASSTATRSITRLGRQVRAEPHPRHRRSNVSSPAATNGLERSGARWRIRTIQKYFRGAIRSRISSVHSTSLQGQRVSPRHRGVRAPPPPPVCKRCVRVWALLLHWPSLVHAKVCCLLKPPRRVEFWWAGGTRERRRTKL